jgi:alpha-amylase/alpha-mannosidase (GH57 family)
MRRLILLLSILPLVVAPFYGLAQPAAVEGGVKFTYPDSGQQSVSVVGDFNGWSKEEDRLVRDGAGAWMVIRKLLPGIYQYKFVLNGTTYVLDPANPVSVDNFNKSAKNSIFVVTEDGEVQLTSSAPRPRQNLQDDYPSVPGRKPIYLNIIWHQHQPLYVNPETDQLSGPWVRTHATKDYYDMAAMLRNYSNVHCTINLTSSLLYQLQTYYVDRLRPFVDTKRNRINVRAFWSRWKGKTDPWIDLALKPTESFDETDKAYLYKNSWNAFGITEVMIDRFPEYKALRTKVNQATGADVLTVQEMRELKFWFFLAYFDPDFLLRPVELPDGSTCNLSDYVAQRSDNTFVLKKKITEADCRRIVVEAFKVMANVVPIHKQLRYDYQSTNGQIEIITTPFYHPILPLIYDSDLAKTCQPEDELPPRFSFPKDAFAQVAKGVGLYAKIFGVRPTGMWPGEGAVAQPVLATFRNNGILWTASDVKVLTRSHPPGQPNTTPYRFPADSNQSIALVFRDTELSDKIGFKYQNYKGEDAAEDFIQSIFRLAPEKAEQDLLLTVILDGENAWEWYKYDPDGKEFLRALYRKLSKLYTTGHIITTTMTEYIVGNPHRGIAAHPVESLPPMEWLWPGSWINANYDTWIGEPEENQGWEYLLRTRTDLEGSGLKQPDPNAPPPKRATRQWYSYMAWESMYAAEGSDWFWWYGNDQTAPGGDKPFDAGFRVLLKNVYSFANRAGASLEMPEFPPIIRGDLAVAGSQGVMAQSQEKLIPVLFICDASAETVRQSIYIAGNLGTLGSWRPNVVRMYDDGSHGDSVAGDHIWSLRVELPIATEVLYKYTNSGTKGMWGQSDEFPMRNRKVVITDSSNHRIILRDTFGK